MNQELELAPERAVASGVPDADLDVRMFVQCRDSTVAVSELPIVGEKPDAHAAIGGLPDAPDEQATREIGAPDVRLDVDRARA